MLKGAKIDIETFIKLVPRLCQWAVGKDAIVNKGLVNEVLNVDNAMAPILDKHADGICKCLPLHHQRNILNKVAKLLVGNGRSDELKNALAKCGVCINRRRILACRILKCVELLLWNGIKGIDLWHVSSAVIPGCAHQGKEWRWIHCWKVTM